MMTQQLFLLYRAVLIVAKEQSGFNIRNCSFGVREVTEDTDASFTCGLYNSRVQWYSSSDYLHWNYTGYCEGSRSYIQKASPFLLIKAKTKQKWEYESTLDIKGVTRQHDIFLKCGYEDTAALCKLRIIAPSAAKNCDVKISKWQLHGTCGVEKMFASDGKYSCMWRENNYTLTSYESLSQYWFGGKSYRKGVCNFDQTMPVAQGIYTYRISIDPGPSNFLVKTINIVPPGYPVHTCRDIIEEGSTVICMCTSSNKGFPPAVFSWDKQNTDKLQIETVQREYNAIKFTCRLTWGPNNFISRTADFILKVSVPVSIVPNSCNVQLSGWKVSGVCTIQRLMRMSSQMCKWSLKNKTNTEELPGFQSVVSYTSEDSGNYMRESCSFMREMPFSDGNYTYSISVSSHTADQCSKTIYIEKPDLPQHNCSKMILEGSNMTCTCFTSYLGSPPARVGWEGSSNRHLAIKGRKQKTNGIVVTCTLTWGVINYTIPYVVSIAYNPFMTVIIASGVPALIILIVLVALMIVCIKRRIVTESKTHINIVHFAAPSKDLDTIAGTATTTHGENEATVIISSTTVLSSNTRIINE